MKNVSFVALIVALVALGLAIRQQAVGRLRTEIVFDTAEIGQNLDAILDRLAGS